MRALSSSEPWGPRSAVHGSVHGRCSHNLPEPWPGPRRLPIWPHHTLAGNLNRVAELKMVPMVPMVPSSRHGHLTTGATWPLGTSWPKCPQCKRAVMCRSPVKRPWLRTTWERSAAWQTGSPLRLLAFRNYLLSETLLRQSSSPSRHNCPCGQATYSRALVPHKASGKKIWVDTPAMPFCHQDTTSPAATWSCKSWDRKGCRLKPVTVHKCDRGSIAMIAAKPCA